MPPVDIRSNHGSDLGAKRASPPGHAVNLQHRLHALERVIHTPEARPDRLAEAARKRGEHGRTASRLIKAERHVDAWGLTDTANYMELFAESEPDRRKNRAFIAKSPVQNTRPYSR